MSAPDELVIVPHTHWDREWYQPFQRFRLQLVTVLDRLLAQLAADPRARFTLDGQTAAIDDYLEIRPEREELVRSLVARGQLALGPWRVLADSFLCSGENLVRNLEIGLRRADELGGAMRVGYLPDQFGHAAQLPQVLRLAGIDVACVWRGVPESVRGTEFSWVAPDGTAVRTRYLPEGGYGGAAGVFAEADAAAVRQRAEEHMRALRRWQPGGPLLGMYGTDHSAPVDGLADLVAGGQDAAFELAPASELAFDVADVRAATSRAGIGAWRIRVRAQPRAKVAALVDVGPLALSAVTAAAGAATPVQPPKNIATGRRALSDLDNGLVHVALRSDGLLDVLAADGTHAAGLGEIVDGGDLGDEYNHAPPGRDRLVTWPDEIWNRERWNGPLTGSLESTRWFNWPTQATAGSRAEAVHTTEVVTGIELRHGEPFVRLTIAFDNRSDDHRVRLHLPLPRPATRSHAEGQFAVVERGLQAEGGFGERPVPTFPAYGWVAAGGLAVLLDHVSEYELVDDGRTLALTLLRSVGLLSRNDNAWREEPAGPQFATPGAQCRGVRTVELGLYLYAGEWHESGLLDAAERYRHPLTAVAGRNQDPASIPQVPRGGIEIGGRGVVLSSCRDVGDRYPEVRLVALTPEPTTATIRSAHDDDGQSMDMRPWQVATAAATFARGASEE